MYQLLWLAPFDNVSFNPANEKASYKSKNVVRKKWIQHIEMSYSNTTVAKLSLYDKYRYIQVQLTWGNSLLIWHPTGCNCRVQMMGGNCAWMIPANFCRQEVIRKWLFISGVAPSLFWEQNITRKMQFTMPFLVTSKQPMKLFKMRCKEWDELKNISRDTSFAVNFQHLSAAVPSNGNEALSLATVVNIRRMRTTQLSAELLSRQNNEDSRPALTVV